MCIVCLIATQIYCLPEGYIVQDASLDDIKNVANPTFTSEQIAGLDQPGASLGVDLAGVSYLPGALGLNNLSQTDGINVALLVLANVTPLRDFLLGSPAALAAGASREPLLYKFGELTRKMWHARNFKPHISPQEVVQLIATASQKQFAPGKRTDPMAFMVWLINKLSRSLRALGQTASDGVTIVEASFRGQLRVVREQVDESGVHLVVADETSTFLCLPLDVPPPPLFQDDRAETILHQVPLLSCLARYDGLTAVPTGAELRRFTLRLLPPYLLLHVKRFHKNNFFTEKNSTIVTAPLSLDMAGYLDADAPAPRGGTRYRLVASVGHTGTADEGSFHVHLRRAASGQWFTINDLEVVETQPETVCIAEAYMLVYAHWPSV